MKILDNDILVNLFVSTQKNNLDLCVEKGIKLVLLFYFMKVCLLLKICREIWNHGYLFVTFKQEVLIKLQHRENYAKRPCLWSCWMVSKFLGKKTNCCEGK